MIIRSIAILVLSLVSALPPLHANVIAESGPGRVSLLEVYSSEGCSSCPPAEEWISGLKADPRLWKEFVPVVFHVDYWDYLGWKDIFARKEYTDRQQYYAQQWQTGTVYTPGFVLNGNEWRRWFLKRQITKSNDQAGSLRIEQMNRDTFKIYASGDQDSLYLSAAILGSGIQSNIQAGENSGKRLTHDFTVMTFTFQEMERSPSGGFEKQITFEIPPAAPQLAIAAWTSSQDSLEPLQATGAYLDKNG